MRAENRGALTRIATATLIGIVVLGAAASVPAATLTVKNNCTYTVFPGVFPPVFNNGGWSQAPGASVSFAINSGFIGRVWGRTGCNGSSPAQCATGSCGGTGLQCAGTTGIPNTSLFEANINASGTDWYDVSYVDAVDNPIGLSITNGSCVSPSACTGSVISSCPASLKTGGACLSPCTKFNTDQFCCRGAFNVPATCIVANWSADAKTYVNNIHSFCPNEYSYAYDDPVGLHTCATGSNYTLTFCPSGNPPPPPPPTPTPTTGGGGGGAVSGAHTISLVNNTAKRVDVAGASTANGTHVQIWDANGTAAQTWSFSSTGVVPAGFSNLAALGPFCMDVTGGNAAAGTKVQLSPCNGAASQSWNPTAVAGGFTLVSALGTNMCLDSPSGSTTNGVQFQIWNCNGTNAQKFIIN
jgi:Thaumatin family/Ricin-type beta-trefoil lectin domain